MTPEMTSGARWRASVRCEPVDRLLFWPKLDGAYAQHQSEPFRSMTISELHAWIGSDEHQGGMPCVRTMRSSTSVEITEADGLRTYLYHTPAGDLKGVDRFDPVSFSWHPSEFPVKGERDIETLRLVFEDERDEFDERQYDATVAHMRNLGEDAFVATGLGISPLMYWIQHLAGIENGLLLLADYPSEVEALFDAMHRSMCRRAEIIAEKSPCRMVYSVENTSTTLISPAMFKRYCFGHLMDYGRIFSSAGKHHLLHMCGHLKLLLKDIAPLPASGIEAFTAPTVGNTTLLDGRTHLGDKVLIGGTNAYLWLEPAETIVATIEGYLDELPHHRGIVVTSGGVMPPACRPETIKQVAEWVKGYPVRLQTAD